jgi:cell division protein FtsB
MRRGPAGRAVDRLRAAVLRLLSPVLADLLAQLERDRHRQRAEIERLAARVEELERGAPRPDA